MVTERETRMLNIIEAQRRTIEEQRRLLEEGIPVELDDVADEEARPERSLDQINRGFARLMGRDD